MQLSANWLAQLPVPTVTAATPVSGGDINQAFRLTTAEGPYFLLVQPQTPASFYTHEVAGLHALGQAFNVPDVIGTGTIDGDAYLLLEFLETGTGSQYQLGQAVARVHQVTAPKFGLATRTTWSPSFPSITSGSLIGPPFTCNNDSTRWCNGPKPITSGTHTGSVSINGFVRPSLPRTRTAKSCPPYFTATSGREITSSPPKAPPR